MYAKLREWAGVAAFVVFVAFFALTTANTAAHNRQQVLDIASRVAEQSQANFDAIQRNGDFQTCVWTSIVRPRVIGHQNRAVRAINHCADKYLGGQA